MPVGNPKERLLDTLWRACFLLAEADGHQIDIRAPENEGYARYDGDKLDRLSLSWS